MRFSWRANNHLRFLCSLCFYPRAFPSFIHQQRTVLPVDKICGKITCHVVFTDRFFLRERRKYVPWCSTFLLLVLFFSFIRIRSLSKLLLFVSRLDHSLLFPALIHTMFIAGDKRSCRNLHCDGSQRHRWRSLWNIKVRMALTRKRDCVTFNRLDLSRSCTSRDGKTEQRYFSTRSSASSCMRFFRNMF